MQCAQLRLRTGGGVSTAAAPGFARAVSGGLDTPDASILAYARFGAQIAPQGRFLPFYIVNTPRLCPDTKSRRTAAAVKTKGASMNSVRMDFQRTGIKANAGRFERGYLKT